MHWILLAIGAVCGVGFVFFGALFLIFLYEEWKDR